ncbi:MAG: tetratricopeptide repeat protein, partial [bacterium]
MELDERAVKFHTLGNSLLAEKKYNDAITQYMKAVEIEPRYASAFYHLAEAYEAKRLDDKSIAFYLKAIELNPSFAEIHIQSGLDTLIAGPLGAAVAEYKKRKTGGDAAGQTPPAETGAQPTPLKAGAPP